MFTMALWSVGIMNYPVFERCTIDAPKVNVTPVDQTALLVGVISVASLCWLSVGGLRFNVSLGTQDLNC